MYRPHPEDFDDIPVAAQSDVPMLKADHKAKKQGRPRGKMKIKKPRQSEKLGGGHFVFRRGDHGRITPNGQPYEHGTYELAHEEAARRQVKHGGTFEVYSRSAIVDGVDVADEWDRAPSFGGTTLVDMTLDMHAEVLRQAVA